ncbi:hypothetical protein Sjap_020177 [Stephania japonica]|uniref:Uncharacterized protein n=1 Tax=Stephania japonica TaxID=461633 RepID=A0AAP0F7L4_9MAGN
MEEDTSPTKCGDSAMNIDDVASVHEVPSIGDTIMMSQDVWNTRGAIKTSAQRQIVELVKRHNPIMGCILETRFECPRLRWIDNGGKYGQIPATTNGLSGVLPSFGKRVKLPFIDFDNSERKHGRIFLGRFLFPKLPEPFATTLDAWNRFSFDNIFTIKKTLFARLEETQKALRERRSTFLRNLEWWLQEGYEEV